MSNSNPDKWKIVSGLSTILAIILGLMHLTGLPSCADIAKAQDVHRVSDDLEATKKLVQENAKQIGILVDRWERGE